MATIPWAKIDTNHNLSIEKKRNLILGIFYFWKKKQKPSTDLVNDVAATKVLAEQKIISDGKEIEIIVISSDEESEERKERKKKEHAKARNTTKQHSARKNVKTFSSVLSARSKV